MVCEQKVQRGLAVTRHRQLYSMIKTPGATDHVDTSKQASKLFEVVLVLEFRPTPTLTRIHAESISGMFMQAFIIQ